MNRDFFEKKTYGKQNKRIIFLLGGWASKQWMYWPVSRLFECAGFRCITYTFGTKFLTPNIPKTVTRIQLVKHSITSSILKLKSKGYKDFSIFGTSLGSLISLLVTDDSIHIRKVIFNTPGIDFAESLWKWDTVFPQFKQELVKRYKTLDALKKEVETINPPKHLKNLRKKDILVYISANDEIVECPEKTLKKIFKEKKINFKLNVNHSYGHVATSILNLINAPEYLRFLNN